MVGNVGDRFAGQPDDIASLENVILAGRRGFDVFVRGDDRRIGKLAFKDVRVGVTKVPLPGLLEQSVASIVFLTVQSRIHLFLGLQPRIVGRGRVGRRCICP